MSLVMSMSELEKKFLQPYTVASQDIEGLATMAPLLPNLNALFDIVDVDNNQNINVREFAVLVRAVTNKSNEQAIKTSIRVIEELSTTSSLSRSQFYIFFFSVFGPLSNCNIEATKKSLEELTEEVQHQHDSLRSKLSVSLHIVSMIQFCICMIMTLLTISSKSVFQNVDHLYNQVVTSTGFFSGSFSTTLSVLFSITAFFGCIIGIVIWISVTANKKKQEERFTLRCFSFLSLLTSIILLISTVLLYFMTGDGETACFTRCGSVCDDAFPINSTTSNDYVACQKLVANGNCTCGFSIRYGSAPEIQLISISHPENQILKGNLSLTCNGFTSSAVSVNADGKGISEALSIVPIGNNITLGSVYGPIVVETVIFRNRIEWNITLSNALFDMIPISVDSSELVDPNMEVSVAVATVQDGRLGTTFRDVNDTFDSVVVDIVAAFGFATSAICCLTGLLGKTRIGLIVFDDTQGRKHRTNELHKNLMVAFKGTSEAN
jgi:hypothetical protein